MVIKRGYQPFVVIRHENEASKSLYKKLGFEKQLEVARIVFTPNEHTKNGDNCDEMDEKEQKNGNGTENGNPVNGKANHNGVNNNHQV